MKKVLNLDEKLEGSLSRVLDVALKNDGLEVMPLVIELISAIEEESQEDEEWLRKLEFDL